MTIRNEERGAVFRQSLRDFPCPVELGKYTPSFGLHRFKQGLRFFPADDEGFTLRGDKRRLLYKGMRRSHRFTILSDTAFEYDCILEREPESNVISLLMEGTENFDFFRQPDFVTDPFLKGSYAVYKKETLIGEGTGKLCHIHRPLIIDARGRRCWGTLAVSGNELRITIPDWWLADAKYPVVVDPTVGTTAVGSQYDWEAEPGEPFEKLFFDMQLPVNRFLVPDTINGLCTGYFYTESDDDSAGVYPVLYSDNANSPFDRRSADENFIDLMVTNANPEGWRCASFTSNTAIESGRYIWFGAFTFYMWFPRFDYGAKCYKDFWDEYYSIPDNYPLFDANQYYDFKLSMYFTYNSAQNHVRTLTQGVTFSDTRKLTGTYKRSLTQTVRVNSILCRFETFFRKFMLTVNISTQTNRRWGEFIRGLRVNAGSIAEITHKSDYYRFTGDRVQAAGALLRGLLLFVRIKTNVFIRDYLLSRFLIAREELVLKSCITREIILESKIK